jgi:hypothetical protein
MRDPQTRSVSIGCVTTTTKKNGSRSVKKWQVRSIKKRGKKNEAFTRFDFSQKKEEEETVRFGFAPDSIGCVKNNQLSFALCGRARNASNLSTFESTHAGFLDRISTMGLSF